MIARRWNFDLNWKRLSLFGVTSSQHFRLVEAALSHCCMIVVKKQFNLICSAIQFDLLGNSI